MEIDSRIIQAKHGFATYPSVFLKNHVADKKGIVKFKWVKQLLFGDWIGLKTNNAGEPIFEIIGGIKYLKVRGRNQDGYILPSEIQYSRVLEVNFIDVGQGDGCHVVTPEDKHFLIDAGDSDNMYRFLKWRFNLKSANASPPPFTVIISHSDKDHYYGFSKIFEKGDMARTFTIEKVYHNGMIETSGEDVSTLGSLITHEGIEYITDLCNDHEDYKKRIIHCSGYYAGVLQQTAAEKTSLRKGSGNLYETDSMKIEVLGPATENIRGKDALPVFGVRGQKGKTKNGHSVVLKLSIGNLSLLLGGDLNEESEDHLIKHYTGANLKQLRKKLRSDDKNERDEARLQIDAAVNEARKTFQVDIAKSCHHGSADFTSEFMRSVNPLATVISSGDNEPHVHPRPDTLGTIGKYSRGERSLIFSTELARSTMEFFKQKNIAQPFTNSAIVDATKTKPISKERVVTVYGMINVRTDGKKVIIAQKLEKAAPRGTWDIHELLWDEGINEFVYKY
jgi:beta-lactamase superfamily II metal-dependent hydrolase